jgi:hypothetical protein
MVVGAIISAASYTASVALSDGGFNNWSWGRFGVSLGIGAISGVATLGIGSSIGAVGSMGFGGELIRAGVHGASNGILSAGFGGGDFAQGFASGALGSLGGSAFKAIGGEFANSLAGAVGFSTVSGGIGAELTGGDFWKGAAIGATIGLLNHSLHDLISQARLNTITRATRQFLIDLGYKEEQVFQDVIPHKNSFWGQYYLEMLNFKEYQSSFTGGYFDSQSGKNSAYLSTSISVKVSDRLFFKEKYALKYYPDRANSIGIVRADYFHYNEAVYETIDAQLRKIHGIDNTFYDMHFINSNRYLKYR